MPAVLQLGFGNFGPTHLAAWRAVGLGDWLYIVDPDGAARARAVALGVPPERVAADPAALLEQVTLVDLLAPTDGHFALAAPLLRARKDLFIEKPMTTSAREARELAALVTAHDVVVQVGFYFRFHPLARAVKDAIEAGRLGRIRYLAGRFHGYKRGRADSGTVQNDAVHFIDQANWLTGEVPAAVDAVTRDHFGRGHDDFALIRLFYPSGAIAQIETGLIQPGQWPDDIVPGATQTKHFTVAGSEGAAEIDYQTGELRLHQVHYAEVDGLWRPQHAGTELPQVPRWEPWQVVAAEFEAFLQAVDARGPGPAPVDTCGVAIADILEAIEQSSAREQRVTL